jgi:hypothetical protein|tara:strand:- start:157 stop:381 length:225 start_codon:yes stop_codon:yes gene_type:complete
MNAQLKNMARQLDLAPEFVVSRQGQDFFRLLLKLASAEAVLPSPTSKAPVLAFSRERSHASASTAHRRNTPSAA